MAFQSHPIMEVLYRDCISQKIGIHVDKLGSSWINQELRG